MGVLTSKKFTSNDPATNKRLEDCATGTPNEVASHFTIGSPDANAIRQLQFALALYRGTHPFEKTKDGRSIPAVTINGVYSKEFAEAIYIYKEINGIKNYAGKIDNIVGIKTIRSLDQVAAKNDTPLDVPVPTPPPETSRRIARRVFTKRYYKYVGLNDNDSWNIADLQTIAQDITNRIQDPEALLGEEDKVQQRLIKADDDVFVNYVDQTTTQTLTREAIPGGVMFTLETTTELLYRYGNSHPVVIYSVTLKTSAPGMSGDGTKQTTSFIPRDVANKSIILTPPKP